MRALPTVLFAALSLAFPLWPAAPALAQAALQRGECVVMLHGMWRSALSMKPLQWRLEAEGYSVVNDSYSSLSHSVPRLAETAVGGGLDECRERGLENIHFVTHSLGGILVRQYVREHVIKGLQRVVMLGPPNQGSQVADYYSSIDILDSVSPPVLEDLRTDKDALPGELGPVDFDLGVIAGTVNRRLPIPGFPSDLGDGTVSVAETVVPGMLDFITMPTTHTFMIWNNDVMDQVVYFLREGRFRR